MALTEQPLAMFPGHAASKNSLDHARFRAETIPVQREVLPEARAIQLVWRDRTA